MYSFFFYLQKYSKRSLRGFFCVFNIQLLTFAFQKLPIPFVHGFIYNHILYIKQSGQPCNTTTEAPAYIHIIQSGKFCLSLLFLIYKSERARNSDGASSVRIL